jgi:hypothetical protein
MAKRPEAKEKTRILIEVGYSKYILPEGTSAELVRNLVNSLRVDGVYLNGENIYYKNPDCSSDFKMQIIPAHTIKKQINRIENENGKDDNKVFLIEQIREEIEKNKIEYELLIFNEDRIIAGNKKIDWPEISHPDFDPVAFIEEVIGHLNET